MAPFSEEVTPSPYATIIPEVEASFGRFPRTPLESITGCVFLDLVFRAELEGQERLGSTADLSGASEADSKP